jgi:hypothetical protein
MQPKTPEAAPVAVQTYLIATQSAGNDPQEAIHHSTLAGLSMVGASLAEKKRSHHNPKDHLAVATDLTRRSKPRGPSHHTIAIVHVVQTKPEGPGHHVKYVPMHAARTPGTGSLNSSKSIELEHESRRSSEANSYDNDNDDVKPTGGNRYTYISGSEDVCTHGVEASYRPAEIR